MVRLHKQRQEAIVAPLITDSTRCPCNNNTTGHNNNINTNDNTNNTNNNTN